MGKDILSHALILGSINSTLTPPPPPIRGTIALSASQVGVRVYLLLSFKLILLPDTGRGKLYVKMT